MWYNAVTSATAAAAAAAASFRRRYTAIIEYKHIIWVDVFLSRVRGDGPHRQYIHRYQPAVDRVIDRWYSSRYLFRRRVYGMSLVSLIDETVVSNKKKQIDSHGR